jgi:hypothetical protein
MDESSSEFRNTLLELVDSSPETMDHPSPDRWIAYQRGELSGEEEARFQEHLVRCRDCFDLAEGAAAFAEADEKPGSGQEVDSAALWRLLRPQLGPPAEPSRQNVREISSGPRRRPSWASRLPMTLAASFFVALVGMTVLNVRQRSSLEAPRPNVAIVDFAAGERLPTLPSAERTISASTGMLVFHPDIDLQVYRLALLDAATGRELWSYELRPDEDSALTLQLPGGLRPGRYRLELSDGSSGRAGRVLETYLLRVTEAGQGE